jgi:heme/copper-type cytochrome/quinol oxidase subunit 1
VFYAAVAGASISARQEDDRPTPDRVDLCAMPSDQPSEVGRSALIGAIVGAVIGVIGGVILHAIVTDSGSAGGYWIVGALLGLVFGAICGGFYAGYFAVRRRQ